MKHISILGSTGSIGTQTLQIVRNNKDLKVDCITGNNNTKLLFQQIMEFSPELVCVYEKDNLDILKEIILKEQSDLLKNTRLVSGMEGLIEAASFPSADIVVTAIVGMVGIRPTMAAIRAGKDIALANKETLVCAGQLIMKAARDNNVKILPVDSEHSAIFQSLNGENRKEAEKILLTASGGPFRGKKTDELKAVTVEQALNHPNWKMGKKITIDSATLANKGLEVIEARWLFDVSPDNIQVVVHPQSVIHSAVQYRDGAVMAQLGTPDMKIPIQYALFYPERRLLNEKRLDLFELGMLTFEEPDIKTFKALQLAFDALKTGGSMPCVFNAANELAVRKFLNKEIKFLEITDIIEEAMNSHNVINEPDLEEIIAVGERIIYNFCQ